MEVMLLSEQRPACDYTTAQSKPRTVCMTETYQRVHGDCAAFASVIKRPDKDGGLSVKYGSVVINEVLVRPPHGNTPVFPPRWGLFRSKSDATNHEGGLPSIVIRRSRDATTKKYSLTLDVQLLP